MEIDPDNQTSVSQEPFRARVRRWFDENLPAGWATSSYVPLEDEDKVVAFLTRWQRTLYQGGWAGLSWPREYGGRGATLLEQAIFQEERDRVKAPPEIGLVGIGMVGPMLMRAGTDAQRQRYLQPILAGDELWCQGFSEPNAGSDLAALRTIAIRDGDAFVVSGQKVWTSRATWAQQMILLARTNQTAPKHKGITAFIVAMDSPGIRVVPIRQINGTNEFCEVFFDAVRVPAECVIGNLNEGWQIAMLTLSYEQVATTRAFEARRLLSDLFTDCSQPGADGGDPPIADPAVRAKLAQLACEVLAARASYYLGVGRVMESGVPGPRDSVGKLHTSELCQRITDLAVSVLGTAGVRGRVAQSLGSPANWPYEYISTLKHTIAAGTSQVQRNIIGERLLGLPK